jgi:hypothetical protein
VALFRFVVAPAMQRMGEWSFTLLAVIFFQGKYRTRVPDGVPEKVVRTVTENSRTLKFTEHGFEES